MAYEIIIKKGNLLNEDADFIVNASNTKLLLGSGVSMAFKRHCNKNLQNEMDTYLHTISKGELNHGDVAITSSCAYNFKYAIHTAVMNYNKGMRRKNKNPTLQTISDILYNIEKYLLLYANETKKPIKIVFPLMGCGVGGLSKIDVLNLYKEFFSKKIEIECEVVIYGFNEDDYKMILEVMI